MKDEQCLFLERKRSSIIRYIFIEKFLVTRTFKSFRKFKCIIYCSTLVNFTLSIYNLPLSRIEYIIRKCVCRGHIKLEYFYCDR